eukprot:4548412-Amphidinium_carterae.2
MAAFEALVPEQIEQHFRLNHARLKTYGDMKREVALLLEHSTASRIQAGDPMDVDSIRQQAYSKGKWGDGKGKKGKGKGEGKEKNKGDKNPSGDPSAVVCYNCGRANHKKSECWRPGGGQEKGKGKSKDKGKSKHVGACEEQAPTQPADAGCIDIGGVSKTCAAHGFPSQGWLKLNLYTGAGATVLPKTWVPQTAKGQESGSTYRTASGQILEDKGPVEVRGYTEGGASLTVMGESLWKQTLELGSRLQN